jgi:hypothetical protein
VLKKLTSLFEKKGMAIIKAVKLINGVRNTVQETRNTTIEDILNTEVQLNLRTKTRKRVNKY